MRKVEGRGRTPLAQVANSRPATMPTGGARHITGTDSSAAWKERPRIRVKVGWLYVEKGIETLFSSVRFRDPTVAGFVVSQWQRIGRGFGAQRATAQVGKFT
jgi:hypothetical protein